MSDRQRSSVSALTQDRRMDVSQQALSCKAIFDAAVRNFERKPSDKFQILVAYQEGISDLRAKGASYRRITQMLTQAGVEVSHDTVARFCRAVIGKTQRRQKSVKSASEETRIALPSPRRNLDAPIDATTEAAGKSRGPRIADPKNV